MGSYWSVPYLTKKSVLIEPAVKHDTTEEKKATIAESVKETVANDMLYIEPFVEIEEKRALTPIIEEKTQTIETQTDVIEPVVEPVVEPVIAPAVEPLIEVKVEVKEDAKVEVKVEPAVFGFGPPRLPPADGCLLSAAAVPTVGQVELPTAAPTARPATPALPTPRVCCSTGCTVLL